MTDAQASPLLSALSVLLAAYGFFFAATRERLRPLSVPRQDLVRAKPRKLGRQRTRLEQARWLAYLLAAAPSAVVVAFSPVLREVVSGLGRSAGYSPLQAALVIVLVLWTGVAASMLVQVVRLHRRIGTLGRLIGDPASSGPAGAVHPGTLPGAVQRAFRRSLPRIYMGTMTTAETANATFAPMDVAGRLDRLRPALEAAGCDALVVSHLPNVRYLSGFRGSAGILVVDAERSWLVTDGRYKTQGAEQLAAAGVGAELVVAAYGEQLERIGAALSGRGRVGLEAEAITWGRQRALAGVLPGADLVPTLGLVEKLRTVKDDGEVARIEAACLVADEALGSTLPLLANGAGRITEAEFAAALDAEMRRLGAEDRSFETIVASGPNGAKPHARPSRRVIQPGELVTVDWGARVEGYNSDCTRTVCVGEPATAELARIAAVVRESQAAGVAVTGPGIAASEVDRACRDVIAGAGWADAFVHSTGHGVGLEIHEAPAVARVSTATLEKFVTVTVEPGVYHEGVGGARIEDTLVVTASGSRPLSSAPKDLVIG